MGTPLRLAVARTSQNALIAVLFRSSTGIFQCDLRELSNCLAVREKLRGKAAFRRRIGLCDDLRHKIDVRQAAEAQRTNGIETVRQPALHGERAVGIDGKAEIKLVWHSK